MFDRLDDLLIRYGGLMELQAHQQYDAELRYEGAVEYGA